MVETLDSFGSLTTGPKEALAGINDFAEGFVAYHPRAANILETAEACPDSALANIYAGMLWMFLERPEAPSKSKPFSDRAQQTVGMNVREQGLLALLIAWQQHDYQRVLRVGEALSKSFPEDLPLLKVMQYHAFNAADAPMMLRMALAAKAANADRAPIHSMIAFGHEQLNDIDEAERAACKALEIDAAEPWAHHALAHVHLSRGTINEGLTILKQSSPSWTGLNSFMFTHNWWHIALFDLANGDTNSALEIYDQRCWGIEPDYSQDQIGAVSLLARLELSGVDVGERWQQLCGYLETRVDDVIQPFLTLQYLYGLARSHSPRAEDLLTLIESQSDAAIVTRDQELWRSVGIPAARGLVAHARENYDVAAEKLASVRRLLWRVGGSHAQRDLFEQILLDARLRAGQWEAARQMLEQRRQWEPDSPILEKRLEQVYTRLKSS
ncbi:MAG: tetratricopeptide repeat protein [Granulosicoccus sp.]